jgi:DNA-binding transcriptional regulator YdaS (Cro superfamily)
MRLHAALHFSRQRASLFAGRTNPAGREGSSPGLPASTAGLRRSAAIFVRSAECLLCRTFALSRTAECCDAGGNGQAVRVQSFSAARREAYRGDQGQAVMLMAVSAMLLAMTGWGIGCRRGDHTRAPAIGRAVARVRAASVPPAVATRNN